VTILVAAIKNPLVLMKIGTSLMYAYHVCMRPVPLPAYKRNSVDHETTKRSLKTGVRAYPRTPVFRYPLNFREVLKLSNVAPVAAYRGAGLLFFCQEHP
jgi:hypothetical protein